MMTIHAMRATRMATSPHIAGIGMAAKPRAKVRMAKARASAAMEEAKELAKEAVKAKALGKAKERMPGGPSSDAIAANMDIWHRSAGRRRSKPGLWKLRVKAMRNRSRRLSAVAWILTAPRKSLWS